MRSVLVLALAAAVAGRPCSLWGSIEPSVSRFNEVAGDINGYELDLKGDWKPTLSGKLLMTFEAGCPLKLSQLDGIAFTLSSSAIYPIDVSYSEVRVGPAYIKVSDLQAALDAHHFVASNDQCKQNYGGPCFSGTVTARALQGKAHVLTNDLELKGSEGDIEIEGYLEPDESEIRLQITKLKCTFKIDADDAEGEFVLGGYLMASAPLPSSFTFGARHACPLRLHARPSSAKWPGAHSQACPRPADDRLPQICLVSRARRRSVAWAPSRAVRSPSWRARRARRRCSRSGASSPACAPRAARALRRRSSASSSDRRISELSLIARPGPARHTVPILIRTPGRPETSILSFRFRTRKIGNYINNLILHETVTIAN
jgi:hypothetical protein